MSYSRVGRLDPRTKLGFSLVADIVQRHMDVADEAELSADQRIALERALKMITRRAG